MKSVIAVVGGTGEGKTGGEQYDARLLAAAERIGIQITRITFQGTRLDRWTGMPVVWRCRPWIRSVELTWKLWRSSGDVLIDIWLAPYLRTWAKHTSRRIILMVHHLRGELEQNHDVEEAESTLICAASRILTVSASSKHQILAYCKCGAPPISVIPPGFVRPTTRPPSLKTPCDKVNILFVGHITRAKGVPDLLQAIAQLSGQSWQLHLVGSGEAEPDTWDAAQKWLGNNNLSTQVTMYGRTDNATLQSLYRKADIFVLPSHWEGYGIAILEAMSFGLPVVSTTAGAIPEVVTHQKNGLLVEPGDAQALKQALATLIQNPKLRAEYGAAAYIAAEKIPDWPTVERLFTDWWRTEITDAYSR